jgi:hypothetical protein
MRTQLLAHCTRRLFAYLGCGINVPSSKRRVCSELVPMWNENVLAHLAGCPLVSVDLRHHHICDHRGQSLSKAQSMIALLTIVPIMNDRCITP